MERDEPTQSTSKEVIHQKKVMLSVWWDFKGIVYFELLPRNQTINSNVYCHQLMKLDKEIKKSGQNWQLVKVSSAIKMTPDLIHLWSLAKTY